MEGATREDRGRGGRRRFTAATTCTTFHGAVLLAVCRDAFLVTVAVQPASRMPNALPVRGHGVCVHVTRANTHTEGWRQVLDGPLKSGTVPSVLHLWIEVVLVKVGSGSESECDGVTAGSVAVEYGTVKQWLVSRGGMRCLDTSQPRSPLFQPVPPRCVSTGYRADPGGT